MQEKITLLIISGIVTSIVCAGILFALLRTGFAWHLATDIPNHRSLHTHPTPRVGGWGVVPAAVLAILLTAPSLIWVACGTLALAIISYIDDRYGLPARYRFAVHFAMVVMLLIAHPPPVQWWMTVPLAIFLVWFINLYNFMDGADGLAGGMAVLGFSAYALAAASAHLELAAAAAALAGSALGFLIFNFPPARIFLGDMGSITLGYLAAALGFLGWRANAWPMAFPLIVFSPFIADASVTLLYRLIRGERVWEAHCEHYYQRMVRMGWSHRRTTLIGYGLMFASILLALLSLHWSIFAQWAGVAVWATALALLGWKIDRLWYRAGNHRRSR